MAGPITPELLARLLDRHAAALELFASQWTHAPEDCVQEAFLQLLKQPHVPENVAPWLFRVVRNRALSMRRAATRRTRHEQQAVDAVQQFSASTAAEFDAEELGRALEHLLPELREIVVARIWGDLTLEQIAEVVGLSRSTVHRRYQEALVALREQLGVPCRMNNETTT